MKNRLLAFAGALALFAVIGKFYAAPAIAQVVRAAAVKNIDEKGRTPYTQFVTVDNCATSPPSRCDVYFPPAPAGKRVVIEHVSAAATMTSGIVPYISLTAGNAGFYLPVNASLRPKLYIVNERVLAYYEAGEVPWMIVAADGVAFTVRASISGYMIDVTQ